MCLSTVVIESVSLIELLENKATYVPKKLKCLKSYELSYFALSLS